MTKQAGQGADQGGGLDVSEAIKPVEKALDTTSAMTSAPFVTMIHSSARSGR